MTLLRAVAAELRKTATLPATLVAAAISIVGPVGISLLNAVGVRDALVAGRTDSVGYTSPAEAAFSGVPLGTVSAVILGVVAVSSEYTSNSSGAGGGRQITATLTATPHRLTVLTAKAAVVLLLVTASALVAIPGSLGLASAIVGDLAPPVALGDTVGRAFGAALYWVLTGLSALALTVVTRSGIVPLVVLIANSSVVSVSFLLINVTPLARYLPDLAGGSLFAGDLIALEDPLGPLAGGLVMAAWTVAFLAVAAAVLTRRDA